MPYLIIHFFQVTTYFPTHVSIFFFALREICLTRKKWDSLVMILGGYLMIIFSWDFLNFELECFLEACYFSRLRCGKSQKFQNNLKKSIQQNFCQNNRKELPKNNNNIFLHISIPKNLIFHPFYFLHLHNSNEKKLTYCISFCVRNFSAKSSTIHPQVFAYSIFPFLSLIPDLLPSFTLHV